MVVLSCSDHLHSAGPRWSDRRSRGRNAHLGVRGAAASGAPRSARSPGNRRARHLTREHVPLADVLAGQVTCSWVRVRSRELSDDLANRPRHDMRDAVPPCEMRYRGEAGDGAPEHLPPPPGPSPAPGPPIPPRPTAPDAPGGDSSGPSRPTPAPQRPQRPLASHPGDALGRLRNNPLDEEDPPEQTVTTTFTPHAFKTTSE